MRISNFYGVSHYFMPQVIGHTTVVDSLEKDGNKILFFDGALPDAETLYTYGTEEELLTAHTPIMEITGLTFAYTYTVEDKKKMIKKIPVDAIDVEFTGDGTIGWAAIVLAGDTGVSDNMIMFTDSIGNWGEDDNPIIIEKMTGVTGDTNTFKDFSLVLRDSSSYEG
jgi:hypothetical protein